jgi:hypothetical protein
VTLGLWSSYRGDAVWRINPDIACEYEFGIGTFTKDPLPEFPAQALDAPRDFDGGTLARFIEGDDG